MGEASAKIKSTASQIGAALSGKVGVLNTLEGEHSEVSSLIKDVIDSDKVEEQRELYHKIRHELLVHTQGEEQGIYAQCRAHEATRNLADKAIQDHMEIKRLLSTLDSLDVGSAQWDQKFQALKAAVETHVEFEEQRLFPTVNDTFSSDSLRELDGKYKSYRKRIEEGGEQLSPKATGTAAA